jgi:HPt (histidine-containing phosphotransfer) domain-containing protein
MRTRAAFAADLPRRREQLQQAVECGQREDAALLLHGLRGSAAYLGETAINQLCAKMETAADAGDWEAVRDAQPRLVALLDAFEVACA